jgi:hypothetical protein
MCFQPKRRQKVGFSTAPLSKNLEMTMNHDKLGALQ